MSYFLIGHIVLVPNDSLCNISRKYLPLNSRFQIDLLAITFPLIANKAENNLAL